MSAEALPAAPAGPGLYLHVPFCAAKCGYCDFASVPASGAELGPGGLAGRYVDALLAHAPALAGREGLGPFATVFVGGGTPSSLQPSLLARLLEGAARLAPGSVETSVEANPESLDADRLGAIAGSGATRISLGVQSLEDAALRAAGRRASAADARRALDLLARSWKGALSVDLIAGLPGETPGGLAAAVREAVAAGARHVSLYDLVLEPGTPLAAAVAAGRLILPGPAALEEGRDAAEEALGAAGLVRYEVSNWAVPGAECRHNLNYWASGEWVGAGSSATGQRRRADGSVARRTGARDPRAWAADPDAGAFVEEVPPRDALFEAFMMGLRATRGVDLSDLAARFGEGAAAFARGQAAARPDALALEGGFLVPTPRGLDILNPVLAGLLERLERDHPLPAPATAEGGREGAGASRMPGGAGRRP